MRVVMQEDVTRDRDEIVLNVEVEPGEFIRKRGCDLSEGQKFSVPASGFGRDPRVAASSGFQPSGGWR